MSPTTFHYGKKPTLRNVLYIMNMGEGYDEQGYLHSMDFSNVQT